MVLRSNIYCAHSTTTIMGIRLATIYWIGTPCLLVTITVSIKETQ
jgi:hypothetical protein